MPRLKRDADPEDHHQQQPDEGHHGGPEGDAETESPEILVLVVADPKQHAPNQEESGENGQGARFLERAIDGDPRIGDEIGDELLEGVVDEARVDVERGIGLRHAPDPHLRVETLRGDDADGDDARQKREHGVLDHEREPVGNAPIGRGPVPDGLHAEKESKRENPVRDEHYDEGPLSRREAELLRLRSAPVRVAMALFLHLSPRLDLRRPGAPLARRTRHAARVILLRERLGSRLGTEPAFEFVLHRASL